MKSIYTTSVKFLSKSFGKTTNSNKLVGNFERVSAQGTLNGWAVDKTNLNDFVKVYAFIDNVLVGFAIANAYRGDLVEAKVKEDGKAGFSIELELTKNNRSLLTVGAKVDLAFDEKNQQPLKHTGYILNQQDINHILAADANRSVSLMDQVEAVIALVTECNNEVDETDEAAMEEHLTRCKHASYMVISIAHQLHKLECYEPLLQFLSQINTPKVLRFCQLECVLFRVMVLTHHNLLTNSVIELLDSAFYERSSDDLAKQQSVNVAVYVDVSVLAFYSLLQTKGILPGNEANSKLLGRLAFVLSFWLYRLNANLTLSLNFLLLLEITDPELLAKEASQNHLAHLRRQQGDNLQALTHCLNSVKQQTDYWWAYHESAIILGMLSNNQRELFKNNLPRLEVYFYQAFLLNPYQSKSFREFHNVLNNYFSSSQALTWQLAEAGFVDKALAERDEDLQLLIQIMLGIYSGKFHTLNSSENAKLPQKNKLAQKIVFVGSKSLFQCYYYRVQQKLEQAEQIDLITDYLDLAELNQQNWQHALMNVAVLYVCRIPATPTEIKLLCYAKGLGIAIVYDIDDLIFDATAFPASLESYAGTIDEKTHLHLTMDNPFFLNALKLADVCVASTQPLAMEIGKHVKEHTPIKIHPNVLSYDLYSLAHSYNSTPSKENQEFLTIVYGSATKAHKQRFYEVFLPAALEVLKKSSRIRLLLVGYFDNIPTQFGKQIEVLEPTPDFMGYIHLIKSADINIAVLEESRLTDTKSEIKWLEAAAFGIPSIVTPTQAYKDVLTDGENVLFASTQAQWKAQLLRLVENAKLRKSIGNAAKKLAFEKFSPQVGERILYDTVGRFIGEKTKLTATKKRVLLVNVFFYPQSMGGATRVFENQVSRLTERYAEDYEVFVLTSDADPDSTKPYYVEQYWFDSVLVTRLNIPPKDWAEYEDDKVYDFCVSFFKEYEFDLIHFHSIQVLTASIVDAAVNLEIPYMITLHDAWWLSIYQFLVNPKGELVDHTWSLGGVSDSGSKADWIVKRRRKLQKLLNKANVVVAVSAKFAQLYQEAGVNNVQVHENYSEPFTHTEQPHQLSDKIILGFIGGMSAHKGYDLVRKTLEEGHFSNMQLIVVNHALHSGEVHYSQWGDTIVEFRAKAKQSEVAKLYAQFDVLLAPSIWPESYGLVTREALQAGLWVIASNRGAIADCIIEGVNGNIVNVENHLGLINALQQLPAQLKNRSSNNQSINADVFTDETIESHLTKLVDFYQLAIS